MKRWILILSLLCAGCEVHHYHDPSGVVDNSQVKDSDSSSQPPVYNNGDVVAVGPDAVRIGIVIFSQRQQVLTDHVWAYKVMFQNHVVWYTEDKLVLVERFNWNETPKPGMID